MEKNSLPVNILGSSFTVQSNGNPQYLRQVVDYLEKKVDEIRQKYAGSATQDPVKISLLAGLNVVDELFRTQEGEPAGGEALELERITERLIDTIDKSLMGN
ncbi:MAG: cell division protein ZapA [Spirochaetaceae bacterium]|nr:MAG: cell division protein ZapA [Spirochaetaceae bacterium]